MLGNGEIKCELIIINHTRSYTSFFKDIITKKISKKFRLDIFKVYPDA